MAKWLKLQVRKFWGLIHTQIWGIQSKFISRLHLIGEDFVSQKWQEYMTKIMVGKAQDFLKVITENTFNQKIELNLNSWNFCITYNCLHGSHNFPTVAKPKHFDLGL